MIKEAIRYQKQALFCFLYLFLFSIFIQAQDSRSIPDIEKIYLHTDRTTYFMGEDLWYKAYVVKASNNLLFDQSGILYVELISPEAKIIARNKTKLTIGLGNGDFHLVDSVGVKPGKYQLRAYTNWNRNFGNDFVFTKDIEIIDVFESKEKPQIIQKSVSETKKRNNEKTKKNFYTVTFFPEGGSLLENVASVIGFKAVDLNGKPINIKGEIYDSNNELVSTFESVHDGMGKTQLLPIEGKNYYAKMKTESGFEFMQDLQKPLKNGYTLSYRNFRGKNIVTIITNQATLAQNPNAILKIVCQARGILYLETMQTLTETSLSFELPKDRIPDGISQITLLDATNKPQSERLVYFEKEHDLEVELTTYKETYQPEEKASISVFSKSKSGEGKSASFSLSVTDTNGVDDDNFDSNICSYFLMESDIRGKVHHPAYYFDMQNPKRLEHLDNLLLTQGWRDFLWKTLPQVDEKNLYKAEKGITISGRVKQLFADKPLVNNNVTLTLMGKKNNGIFSAVTDSIGRFQFENLEFSGKAKMYLNTRDEKGKFKGEMLLDSIERSPMHVSLQKEPVFLSEPTNTLAENVLKKITAFGVKPENLLKEVTITNTIKKKDDMVANYGNYGFADNSYVADESTHLFTTIYELIEQKIPGIIASVNSVRFRRFEFDPIFILNGRVIQLYEMSSWIDVIQPGDVIKIDAITGAQATSFFGEDGQYGIIAIYTKPNTGNRPKKEVVQSIKQELEGFYTARVFYSPDPEKPNPELYKTIAVRNTIYWNPYVHPDKTGNASVEFYNSKVETKVKVALEGITSNGIPVVKRLFYSIKK
ncbi:TonB-dependent receptor plug [Flavobacterium daejeonense]|nr:TonB-dependent receptor plug [Flavobacterium daejeonense]